MKVADRSNEEIRDELRRIVPQFVSPAISADERSRRHAA
jgi:hypothetical protein